MSFPMISMGGGPGRGIFPGEIKLDCTVVGSAVVAGDCVALDITDSDTAGLSTDPGDTSLFSTVRLPIAGDLVGNIFGIAEVGIAEDAVGKITFSGIVNLAKVDTTTALGDKLVPTAASGTLAEADAVGGVTAKIVAMALEADAAGIAKVWFDGVTGFGVWYDET